MVSAPSPSLTRECCERVESVVFLPLKDETQDLKFGDAALTVLDEATVDRHITPEEDARVLRKIDLWILSVIILVYFLQQLDKCVGPTSRPCKFVQY